MGIVIGEVYYYCIYTIVYLLIIITILCNERICKKNDSIVKSQHPLRTPFWKDLWSHQILFILRIYEESFRNWVYALCFTSLVVVV